MISDIRSFTRTGLAPGGLDESPDRSSEMISPEVDRPRGGLGTRGMATAGEISLNRPPLGTSAAGRDEATDQ